MRREIKFRVWCGETIGMEYNIVAGKFGAFYARIDTKDSASLSPTSIYPEDCPVMQFTGLTDKNGKEIYEGDIILCTPTIDYESYLRTTDVVWSDDLQWCIREPDVTFNCGLPLTWGGWQSFEVIGNIYQPSALSKTPD